MATIFITAMSESDKTRTLPYHAYGPCGIKNGYAIKLAFAPKRRPYKIPSRKTSLAQTSERKWRVTVPGKNWRVAKKNPDQAIGDARHAMQAQCHPQDTNESVSAMLVRIKNQARALYRAAVFPYAILALFGDCLP